MAFKPYCNVCKSWHRVNEPHVPDNRMVRCVLSDYEECPAKVPEACICYQYQQTSDVNYGNLYERNYAKKYGKDES